MMESTKWKPRLEQNSYQLLASSTQATQIRRFATFVRGTQTKKQNSSPNSHQSSGSAVKCTHLTNLSKPNIYLRMRDSQDM